MEHGYSPERVPAHRREAGPREPEADAWFLIQAGIDRALDSRRDIDDATARIIAFNLAPSITSNLSLFAQTGGRGLHTDNAALRDEYLPIYHSPATPQDIRHLIDWLGAYLVNRENPVPSPNEQPKGPPLLRNILWQTAVKVDGSNIDVSVRADQPVEVIEALPAKLAPLIHEAGDAMTAFLSLAGVDATGTNLEESFYDSYRGSFTGRDEALRNLVELDEVEAAVAHIADSYAGGEFVILDLEALWDHLQSRFEIVEHEGQLHAFDK